MAAETNYHLGVDCPFTKSVWREIESKIKNNNLWFGDSILSCMKNWCFNDKVKQIRSLPIIVTWFIWKAKNQSCFDDFTPSPTQFSSSSLGLLYSYQQENEVLKIRIPTEEIIDKSKPRGFFDGLASGDPHLCGARGILFIKDDHYFTFKVDLGIGTNNLAELCALKLLLTLVLDKQISKNQVFGDSLLVIN